MIKIQEHLDENPVSAAATLEILVEDHWKFLNPSTITKPVRLKTTSLIARCEKAKNQCRTPAFCKKYEITKITSLRLWLFFDAILKNNSSLLKKIVLSDPNALISIIYPQLQKLLPNRLLYVKNGAVDKQKKLGRFLSEEVFDYGRFRGSQYCPQLFRQKMNGTLYTCPYCNLNPITITQLPRNATAIAKQKAYLDVDHFYPKVLFPYFSVSFYNLVPSCHDCNSSEKGPKLFLTTTHVHPYVDSFDKIYEFGLNSVDLVKGNVVIECRNRKNARVDKTADDLNLVDRYNGDTQIVSEILKYYKANIHTLNKFNLIHSQFFFSHFPLKASHILRRQRAKLLRDIFIQIGGAAHFLLK